MPDIKISALPVGVPQEQAVVPATNAAGTLTQKITLIGIAQLASINSINGVTIVSAQDGDLLKFNGSTWANERLDGGNF